MSYTCSSCDAQFKSAAGVTQYVALHHNACTECNKQFDDTDSLRNYIPREPLSGRVDERPLDARIFSVGPVVSRGVSRKWPVRSSCSVRH